MQEAQIMLQSVTNHLEKVSALHDEVNKQLNKSRKQMQKRSSVHRRNNPYEPGQLVTIAPDTDMNPTIRKRKIQTNFKDTGTVVSMMNNNKTIVIETPNGSTVHCPVKRIRRIKKNSEK
ncbi:31961_t:CDS:1, partial [Racocetra persica]